MRVLWHWNRWKPITVSSMKFVKLAFFLALVPLHALHLENLTTTNWMLRIQPSVSMFSDWYTSSYLSHQNAPNPWMQVETYSHPWKPSVCTKILPAFEVFLILSRPPARSILFRKTTVPSKPKLNRREFTFQELLEWVEHIVSFFFPNDVRGNLLLTETGSLLLAWVQFLWLCFPVIIRFVPEILMCVRV